MTPPHEGSFSKGMITGDGPIMFLSNIANAYSPDKFIVIQSEGFKACLYIFSLIFFISSLLFFIKNRTVNVLYLSGVFMFAVFFSIVYAPCARHMGHLFILLIACWWIGPKISALASRLITALLIIQFLLGWSAYIVDWKGIFSNGQRTAQYIQQHHLEDLPIIAGGYESATVAGYLQKPVFYAMQARWGTFLSYNNQYFTLEQIFDYLKVLSRLYQKDVLLILPNALDFSSLSINDAKASILKEESFVDDIGVGEKYYLYIYKYKEEA
jgi:hypothetical protein